MHCIRVNPERKGGVGHVKNKKNFYDGISSRLGYPDGHASTGKKLQPKGCLGSSLWIFLIIGAMIVLLQLIPATILFFSFIGTTSAMVFKGKKVSRRRGSRRRGETGSCRAICSD